MPARNLPPSHRVVLVMEDQSLLRMDTVDMLERAGFGVVEAATTADAIAILETRPDIRLVVADVDMPGGEDGIVFAAVIRRRWPPIGIIVLSNLREAQLSELPVRARYLSKPFAPERLVAAINQMAP